ncbi:MAG: YkvA family protein [Cyanobacteria bacterium P01_G01_bin.54]
MSFSVKSLYDWYRNTLRNPKYRWWIIVGTLAYIVSPIDIAPDFLPFVGQIDDTMIVSLLFVEVAQMVMEFTRNKRNATVDSSEAPSSETSGTVDVNAVSVEES